MIEGSSFVASLVFFYGGLSLSTTFDVLLESYRDLADSERMKGSYFEQLVARYLENDGVPALQYTNV